MKKSVVTCSWIFSALVIAACSSVPARAIADAGVVVSAGRSATAACPTNRIQPFTGQWPGSSTLFAANGATQKSTNTDEFAVIDCQTFTIQVTYKDAAGNVSRVLNLTMTAKAADLFDVNGTIKEGTTLSPMTGSFKVIQDGTLLGSFVGAIGGQVAYLNELINITAPAHGGRELVRTVQMYRSERGGEYLGTRVVRDYVTLDTND